MTPHIDTLAIALVQSFALVAASISGERWSIAPAVASVVALGFVAWRARRVPATATSHVDAYRTPALRADDATVEVPSPRPAKRVLREEYVEAKDAAFPLCVGAGGCGALGFVFAAVAWQYGERAPLILCGGFTVAGFVLLGWWARCRSTVQAWRDQERERGER